LQLSPNYTLFPYTTLFRSRSSSDTRAPAMTRHAASTRFTPVAFEAKGTVRDARGFASSTYTLPSTTASCTLRRPTTPSACATVRSEEHTSELQSRGHLVCR